MYVIGNNIDFLKNTPYKSVDLCYMDPPFFTKRDFGDFKDKWECMSIYLSFIEERLKLLTNVVNGVIIVHSDTNASHYIKVLMDKYFNFVNEIIWKTTNNKKSTRSLVRSHDTILVYANKKDYTYNQIYFPYDDEYRKKNKIYLDDYGEYITSSAHNSQPNVIKRENLRYEWNGHHKQWWISKERMEHLDKNNGLSYNKKGVPRIKRYLEDMDGIPLKDVWTDIPSLQINEKLGYATQKPVKLLERLITLYSNEGDMVLDPFAGSGTTGRACINLNRNYFLIDENEKGKELFEGG